MTYLNLVNNVLRRLREDAVTTVSENTYSAMVGDFVNDAKRLVEDAADWSGLRTTLVIPTVASDNQYSLTGSGDSVKVFDVINDTNNSFMGYQTKTWFNEQLYTGSALEGTPTTYTFDGLDSSGDTQVLVYPTPDAVYSLRFNVTKRQGDLSADVDTLLIPSAPVVHLAVALLARERGETGGTSAAEYFAIADKFLGDAVALDAAKHPEEMVWYS
jgi:hypothetical protein